MKIYSILLIDDDEDEYLIFKDYLSDLVAKHTLVWADTYDKGIQLLREDRFDICFIDLNLGIKSGLDLYGEIKVEREVPPIILLTGQESRTIDLQAIESGVSDYIVKNLDQTNITEKFPTKYFPKEQIEPILAGIRQNCDWKNKDGKFVDFFTSKNIGGIDQTAFIYEYYMKCDSVRFILSFSVEDEPELMGLNFEPIEKENKMILFPEKQLKNR